MQPSIEICDVADREAVAATTARILERHPAVDLLVNSAGILVRGSFVEAPVDEIERALVVNYLGCVWVTRGLLDGLREAARTKGRSHIATIASTTGAIVFTPAAPYSASKFAQVAFSRSLRASLRGTGVEVHTIMPGFVTTPGSRIRRSSQRRSAGRSCSGRSAWRRRSSRRSSVGRRS